jgi:hypothetical protein
MNRLSRVAVLLAVALRALVPVVNRISLPVPGGGAARA